MDFVAVVDQAIALLRQRGRLTYRTLKRHFALDDTALDDLTVELIKGQRLAADEDGEVLVWTGEPPSPPAPAVAPTPAAAPLGYTPPYLAEKILTSRSAMETPYAPDGARRRRGTRALVSGMCLSCKTLRPLQR